MITLQQQLDDQNRTEMLTAALQYAEHGWSIFPVHHPLAQGCSCGHHNCRNVGKHPCTVHGAKDATTDPAVIKVRWQKRPRSNIGVHVGRSGLVVLDIDPRHNGRIAALPLAAQDLITPIARTGGGGSHLFYRAPLGFEISNSAQALPEGIDIRASNGYIVAPPSLHQSGRRYAWQPGQAPWELLMLPLPASLMPMLKVKTSTSAPALTKSTDLPQIDNRGSRHPYVEKAFKDELDQLARASQGHRNNCLNQASFNLGQFIEAGLLAREEVEIRLQEVARTTGLNDVEIQKTIDSGISAGLANPRRSWPDLTLPGQQAAPQKSGQSDRG